MTSFKQLFARLNQVFAANRGNALFALFLTLLCETVGMMCFFLPSLMLLTHGAGAFNDVFFALLLVFCALVVWVLFQYGFLVLILRMVRREFVTLGYVFYGFRSLRRTLPLAAVVAGAVCLLSFAFAVLSHLLSARLGLALPADGMAQFAALGKSVRFVGVMLAAYLLLLVAVGIHFVFIFYAHYDCAEGNLLSLFGKSARLMRGRRFRLLGLALRAGARNLALAAVALLAVLFVPATNEAGSGSGGLSLVSALCNLVYLVNVYTALLRMYFAVPVLYTDAVSPTLDVRVPDGDSVVLAEAAALLAGGEDADGAVGDSAEPPRDGE